MPLHPDKLAGLSRRFRPKPVTNPRPIAPISRPGPRRPAPDPRRQNFRTDARNRPGPDQYGARRRQVAQRVRRQQAAGPANPNRLDQYRQQRTQRPRASMQRQAKAKLLEKEPREPGVPTLLQKLAYRMHQGRLNRHFMDLQERRKESGFRKVQ